ncbi:multicopper oxidase family protein [Rariglobus hedericola]|uniref:Copper oxidase n=1 Tax=Rariglobus hedericola TaxID=2597822 RepID=A0A556QJP7_9BACT|nr:multicopper oxidase domain-containing protein [Rariglobus hedericola]TSJ76831.1 copper oxidase [Rariglobus hedericola]
MRALRFLALLGTSVLLTASVAHACNVCGGKGKASRFAAAEAAPKASQLFPNAPVVEYSLDIAETTLSPAGKLVRALTLNGSTPGPVLRFHEGDVARIHVNNRLAREETSVHWHGLLVPNLEDGVPYLTTPPILPGQSRTFEFHLKQAGTYWYHSHTGLQEQRGVYGSIVIEPRTGSPARTDLPRIDREEVLVLSDWTNENPSEVIRSLLRRSDWYALRKGTAQSLLGAFRAGHLKDYLHRERARLPAMDVSDVAYDAFLINGRPLQHLAARPGETIRLRVINAAASTYFYLNSATGPLTIIAADGIDVRPIQQNRLLIGMAETYDVLVTVPADGAWEIRATSQDNSGHASLLLGDIAATAPHVAPAPGPLEIYSMDMALSAMLDDLDESGDLTDAEALAGEADRPLPPYKRLHATAPTTLPAGAPVRELTLKLTGDMQRYLWSLNGQTMAENSTIPVKKGEVLRLVLVNNTMMHHPMHLHGHFFRLLMPDAGDPAYSPLKHTVDVPPMSRRVIEFYANEDKDWLLHCHLLYHMMSGMARAVSYDNQGSDHQPALGEHGMDHPFFWFDGTLQSQMSTGLATLQRGRENLNLAWESGWGRVDRAEYEIDATYSHYFNPRWTVFGGYRLTDIPDGHDAVIAGATYTLPYLVNATATLQSNGDARLGLAKTIPLTARLGLIVRADYDTAQDFSWMTGLTYTLTKQFSLIGSYDSDYGAGAGFFFRF